MGCGSCGTVSANGKPAGCGSSGGCSTGGCNKMNTYNWLSDIPLSDFGKPFSIVEISFNQGSRKEYFQNSKSLDLYSGALVTVEGVNGYDVGTVSLYGELVKLQLKKYNIKEDEVQKRILRFSQASEIELLEDKKLKEQEILVKARAISRSHNLDMKIGQVALQADGKKLIIYYTANSRVDFREVLKIFASTFNARIEMKQIGARQESGIVGGIGSCGRELCCSTWLTDFKAVGTHAARYQNLSINQTKLSGQCGKLKCCLNYELDTYMEAIQALPEKCDEIQVKDGKCKLVKKDVLKGLLYFSFLEKSRQYPLTIERVVYILEQNRQGIYPDELGAEIEVSSANKTATHIDTDAGFINDVGQMSYDSLVQKTRQSKKKKKPQNATHQGGAKNVEPKGKPVSNKPPVGKQQNKPQPTAGNRNNNPKPIAKTQDKGIPKPNNNNRQLDESQNGQVMKKTNSKKPFKKRTPPSGENKE